MENQVKWNDYKKKLEKTLKGTVVYELVGIKQNPMVTDRVEMEIPFMTGVPSKDRIIEKVNGEDHVVDIAYITSYAPGNVPVFGQILFKKAQAGALLLSDKRADDIKLYEYLERTNYNASNPNRDTTKAALFRRVDKSAELKEKRERRKDLREALNIVEKLTQSDLTRLSIALNISGIDMDDIRGKVEDFAEKNPLKLLAMLENNDTEIMRRAEEAKKAGMISVDTQARHIKSASDQTLYTWAPGKGIDWKEQFVRFVKSEEGSAFYKELVFQLDAKK